MITGTAMVHYMMELWSIVGCMLKHLYLLFCNDESVEV